ncbi:Golgi resident protein [Schistosoma japonicum]|uniref:Golgi resident protein n=1 Tax=Schistosoma japonicum TaxID=6182 RepID=A0A4Z2D0Z0_SCHJA|nr:Golgi resident protein GCP60 [Schistosoma japonicum]KAH8853313.1 Golgi resident protein GCP60 [Schistosoma japonicum]KAH8853314.1 Golgi resident protein GCP60 [Schistosoma japonicum]KAH8853315.1 Golgi resident protein GCP60 [Schistosoma japonicum]KAH8853316.1 Golgi resident protein GCP60 [Schistosoma japonicum]
MGEAETNVSSLDKFEALSLNDPPNLSDEMNETSVCVNERCYGDQGDLNQKENEIKSALVQQTKDLYEQYAREQFPKDPDKQKELIAEMQEQYFDHYFSEVYRFQLAHQQQQLDQLRAMKSIAKNTDDENANSERDSPEPLPLIPATIWTRKEIAEFKKEILDVQKECCIKISSLATATVRVPTHPNGKAICWEFATDHYDLGFGLYFEWDIEPPENISVNISESSDEEGAEDEDEEGHNNGDSVEQASRNENEETPHDLELGRKSSQPRVPTDELIPIYRRDCHTEVYCGSHQYPGVGVYVFKFDNSFSLWRSKWLYYRIFYTH